VRSSIDWLSMSDSVGRYPTVTGAAAAAGDSGK
jgi:hypothetical protein